MQKIKSVHEEISLNWEYILMTSESDYLVVLLRLFYHFQAKNVMKNVLGFLGKTKNLKIMKRKLNVLKTDKIGLCDSNLAKRMLKKQTSINVNPDR